MKNASLSVTTFQHLLVGVSQQQAAHGHQLRAPSTHSLNKHRPMTTAETAKAIIAAGEKARGSGDPSYARERVSEMMSRSQYDRAAGNAAAIIQAGAKARGETI